MDGFQVEQESVSEFVPYTTTQWCDLSDNRYHLDVLGYQQQKTLGGVRCFEFNGSSYFQSATADTSAIDLRYGGTVEMWLYAASTAPSARKTIFEKKHSTVQSYQGELAVTWEVGQDLTYYRHLSNAPPTFTGSWGATYDQASIGSSMTAGAWNHVVIVLQPHLSTGQAYLNGVASGSYVQKSWQLPSRSENIRIGTGYAGTCLQGGVASVRLYSKIFDAADVKYNYGVTKARFGL
jgi:hypothetical protein